MALGMGEKIWLGDGRMVTMRSTDTCDDDILSRIRYLYAENLSQTALYYRFFGPVRKKEAADDAEKVTSIKDPVHNRDVVVTVDDKDGKPIRVVGHCGVVSNEVLGMNAEAHVVVDPEYRRQHLATLMLAQAAREAKAAGVSCMVAEVKTENRGIVPALKKCAEEVGAEYNYSKADGFAEAEIVIDLKNCPKYTRCAGTGLARVCQIMAKDLLQK